MHFFYKRSVFAVLTLVVTAVSYKKVKGQLEYANREWVRLSITGNTVFNTASIYSVSFILVEERKDEPPGAEIPSEEPNGVQR